MSLTRPATSRGEFACNIALRACYNTSTKSPHEIGALPTTKIQIVSSVDRYRYLAKKITKPTDRVIEIGCAQGRTTRELGTLAANVFAVDLSGEMLQAARKNCSDLSNVCILRLNAFHVEEIKQQAGDIGIVFLDIGGNAPAHQALFLANLYLEVFRPEHMVIRNIVLAKILSNVVEVETSDSKIHRRFILNSQRYLFERATEMGNI